MSHQQPTYLVNGRRLTTDAPKFADAIAAAHAHQWRPRCLCAHHGGIDGVEMYVARLAGAHTETTTDYIVKRMPNTGSRHAPNCASYEPPAEASGLGQVLGSAITEDPATGETTLKLDFSMSKLAGRSTSPTVSRNKDSVTSAGTKLSLRGLLHYLWDQAELTHWHPGFAGKRSWAAVRRHLLQAAENQIARGGALDTRLYIPELFSVERRNAINARRMDQWAHAVAPPGGPQHLMLLIAEVKDIVPARYGFKAIIKHVPDQLFALEEQLYRRMGRRFERELSLWGASDAIHMMLIATFGLNDAGMPTIGELSLMPVTGQWLPIEDSFEQQLIERLVREGRTFVKGLRYNLPAELPIACATLTDTTKSPLPMFIESGARPDSAGGDAAAALSEIDLSSRWCWKKAHGGMPPIPKPSSNRHFAGSASTQCDAGRRASNTV